jgi:hypothetical protein
MSQANGRNAHRQIVEVEMKKITVFQEPAKEVYTMPQLDGMLLELQKQELYFQELKKKLAAQATEESSINASDVLKD